MTQSREEPQFLLPEGLRAYRSRLTGEITVAGLGGQTAEEARQRAENHARYQEGKLLLNGTVISSTQGKRSTRKSSKKPDTWDHTERRVVIFANRAYLLKLRSKAWAMQYDTFFGKRYRLSSDRLRSEEVEWATDRQDQMTLNERALVEKYIIKTYVTF